MYTDLTDIHCHMMPSVDDGAQDMKMAQIMMERAYQQGIRSIILTPHFRAHYATPSIDQTQKGYEQVKNIAEKRYPDLHIYLGNEVYMDSDSVRRLTQGKIRTLSGSDYVLAEFSTNSEYSEMRNALSELQSHGFLPVVAHIERYKALYREIDRVQELRNMGVEIQINMESVNGELGWDAKSFVKGLLKLDMVDYIASDAHNLTDRSPDVQKCVKVVDKIGGEELVQRIFRENPRKIIEKRK